MQTNTQQVSVPVSLVSLIALIVLAASARQVPIYGPPGSQPVGLGVPVAYVY